MVLKQKKSKIYLGYGGERFVFYSENKRVTGTVSKYKTLRAFKQHIQSKGYLFKTSKKVRVTTHKDAYSAESSKPINKGADFSLFRVVASYHGYVASSGWISKKSYTKSGINEGEAQAMENLAMVIVSDKLYGVPSPPKEDDIEGEIQQQISEIQESDVNFSYIYLKHK